MTLEDGLANAAATAVTDFKNLRSAISSTLKQIAGDIIRSGVKRALRSVFEIDAGGVPPNPFASGGGGGGVLGAIISVGRRIFGFAEGGLIRGPGTGTSDSIPALVGGRRPIAVSNNEFIQPERAVKHYGIGFMEAVRTLSLPKAVVPRFNFGGMVGAHQRARFASGGSVGSAASNSSQPLVAPVVVQVINNGTPQRVSEQRQEFDGKQLVVSVMLDDISRNGRIAQALTRR